MACLKITKLYTNKKFIKMKKSTTDTFKHGIAKPMLAEVPPQQSLFDFIVKNEK